MMQPLKLWVKEVVKLNKAANGCKNDAAFKTLGERSCEITHGS